MIEHGPLLERLLAGDFICAVSDDNAYRHLSNEETREAIDAYLRPLNRRLASNEDASVYFLAWRQLKRIEPRLSALAQKIKQRQQEVSA